MKLLESRDEHQKASLYSRALVMTLFMLRRVRNCRRYYYYYYYNNVYGSRGGQFEGIVGIINMFRQFCCRMYCLATMHSVTD